MCIFTPLRYLLPRLLPTVPMPMPELPWKNGASAITWLPIEKQLLPTFGEMRSSGICTVATLTPCSMLISLMSMFAECFCWSARRLSARMIQLPPPMCLISLVTWACLCPPGQDFHHCFCPRKPNDGMGIIWLGLFSAGFGMSCIRVLNLWFGRRTCSCTRTSWAQQVILDLLSWMGGKTVPLFLLWHSMDSHIDSALVGSLNSLKNAFAIQDKQLCTM